MFYLFNIPALLVNCIDFIFYRFTQKRATGDLFTSEVAGDIKNNLFNYISDFWYVLLILIILVFLMEFMYRKIKIDSGKQPSGFIISALYIFIFIGLFIIGARGGLQYKPITMQAAARYAPPRLIPLVLNTPFTIIKTWDMQGLSAAKYFPDEKAELLMSIRKSNNPYFPMKKLNVIIIIMESFSREYIGFFNTGHGYTPFLDSLCRKSFVFSNAFANGKRSIEGIPAVTAGLPALMDEAFITSAYNTNRINSIAGLLHAKGYVTSFFHGGNNGSMGFDNFSSLAGYDKFYGRNEYIGPATDYDGSWGIYDQPFFRFFKNEIDKMPVPFCTTIFSISSHHPYALPNIYKNKFPKGKQPIHESVGYADFALQTFFNAASTSSWFNNTLFVITADHTGPAYETYYQTSKGIFEIPIIFYCPSDTSLKGISGRITQQADIFPSILDYLNYSGSYSAFGTSAFKEKDNFAVNYNNNLYQYFNQDYLLQFDGDSTVGFYQYHRDSFLLKNLAGRNIEAQHDLELKTKAVIQQYHQSMIHNSLVK